MTAADAPTGHALPAGYHRVDFPMPCGKTLEGDEDCGVPLGDACRSDADCGDGVCWTREGAGWPNGLCVVEADAGCRPRGAVLYEEPARGDRAVARGWIPACSSDADCRRIDGHQCSLAVGGCVRDLGREMVIEAIPRDAVCEALGTMEPLPDGDAGVADMGASDAGMPPARPDGGPGRPDGGGPPELFPCDGDGDCVNAPGPQPQHCDREGFCRPERPGGG